MVHNPPEHVVEVLPGIDFAVLAGLNEAHEQRRCPASPLAAVPQRHINLLEKTAGRAA